MSFLDRLFGIVEPVRPTLQTREVAPVEGSLESFAWSILGNQGRREWRLPTVDQALGVPAVLNAVSIISTTTGTLSMQVKRDGQVIDPPPVVRRPNPLTTPQEFWRDTAYSLATRGEAFWWIAKRDDDRSPLALFPINPVQITADSIDGRLVWRWGDRTLNPADVVQLTYLRELGQIRGKGPLQIAGAALSVAVEAQDWAANFYAQGGFASTLIKHASELDPTPDESGLNEAQRLLAQWQERIANNVTRVIDQNIESVEHHQPNESAAQMLQARNYQNGEVANMFGIPGPLLEYSAQGSSLTYRNIPSLIRQLVDLCLRPRYWEAMEHAMSDLLPRSQKASFDTVALMRDDAKTQMDVATLGLEKGVLDRDEARALVGVDPSIDDVPVPFAPPRAVPTLRTRSEGPWRCEKCDRKLAESQGMGTSIRCRCGTLNVAAAAPVEREAEPMNITVNSPPPAPAPNIAVTIPDSIALRQDQPIHHDPVQMVAPESVPQMLDEGLVARLEAALAPKQRRIERDADGRMVRIVEDVA